MCKTSIGFDIGGTWMRAAVVRKGKIIKRHICKTPDTSSGFVKVFIRVLKQLGYRKGYAIGVAVPGVIKGQTIVHCVNAPALNGLSFKDYGFYIQLTHDARAWLLGAIHTSDLHAERVLAITLGTGIGRAMAIKGKVVTIKRFENSEIWEPEYQNLRRRTELATYLAWQLRKILRLYRPNVVLLGGGVMERRPELKKQLLRELSFIDKNLRVLTLRNNEWLGCLGASFFATKH